MHSFFLFTVLRPHVVNLIGYCIVLCVLGCTPSSSTKGLDPNQLQNEINRRTHVIKGQRKGLLIGNSEYQNQEPLLKVVP